MWQKIIDSQYRRPSGLLGWYVGRQMAQDHLPENEWTISILDAQSTDQILEIGFGSGIAVQRLSKIAAYIAGVDFSKTMVRSARRRNAAAIRQKRVDLRYGHADSLPFKDEQFDKVFSIHSIYFWPQPLNALREIHRVLKPGGTVTLTILPKEKWNANHPDLPIGTPECTPYSGHELEAMLLQAGFASTRTHSGDDPAHPSNFCVQGIK